MVRVTLATAKPACPSVQPMALPAVFVGAATLEWPPPLRMSARTMASSADSPSSPAVTDPIPVPASPRSRSSGPPDSTVSPAASATTARGPNISPEEDLALARSWINVSEYIVDMDRDCFWEKVADVFVKQPEVSEQRTPGSLRSRFSTLQKQSQKYNAAEAKYRSAIPSGESEAETVKNIMTYYRVSNKVLNKKKERVPAPMFKSVAAAHLLATCPKFSSKVLASSTGGRAEPGAPSAERRESVAGPSEAGTTPDTTSPPRVAPGTAEPPAVEPAIPAVKPSAARPRGVKRTKASLVDPNPAGAAVERLATSVTSMKEAMVSSNRRKADLAGLALEAKLVDMLDEGAEKQTMVRDSLRRTRQASTATDSATASAQQRTPTEVPREVDDNDEEEEG